MSPNNKHEAQSEELDLFAEAERQLNICNACRYCEGYCAVFPALESRTNLSKGDIMHLSNLCHDCRDCYYACMYSPPHVFSINPPQIFSEIRRTTYKIGSTKALKEGPQKPRGLIGAVLGTLISGLILILFVIASGHSSSLSLQLGKVRTQSPYQIIPYAALLPLALLPFAWGSYIAFRAANNYWREIHGKFLGVVSLDALYRALMESGNLSYLKGGGVGCAYPDEEMSPARRHLHSMTFYGFIALLGSTISAGILEDILGIQPPYGYLSVPVILGLLGGISMIFGCTGLMILKWRSDPAPSDRQMITRDYVLLISLIALALSGFLVLILRTTPLYGVLLVLHLALVLTAFAIASYSKFTHFLYRFLSLVKDNLEQGGLKI